jgi:hypothetical protein
MGDLAFTAGASELGRRSIRTIQSAATTAMKESPLAKKHPANPNTRTAMPAKVGPTTRDN